MFFVKNKILILSNKIMKTMYLVVLFIIVIGLIVYLKNRSSFEANIEATTLVSEPSDDTVLIIYAPWCGHCKKSMNEFEDAVAEGNGKVMLIDGTKEEYKPILKKHNVNGFPTIIKGSGEKYTGDRSAKSIINFAK